MRNFLELNYQRPNIAELKRRLKRLSKRFRREQEVYERQNILEEFQALLQQYEEMYRIALLRQNLHKSEFFANELSFYNSIKAEVDALISDFYAEFLRTKLEFKAADPAQSTINRLALDSLALYGPDFSEARELERQIIRDEWGRLSRFRRQLCNSFSTIQFASYLRPAEFQKRYNNWQKFSEELLRHSVEASENSFKILKLRQHLQNAGGFSSAYEYAKNYSKLFFATQGEWLKFKEGLAKTFMPLVRAFLDSRVRKLGEDYLEAENFFSLLGPEGLALMPTVDSSFIGDLAGILDEGLGGDLGFFTSLHRTGYIQELQQNLAIEELMPMTLPHSKQAVILYPAYEGAPIDLAVEGLIREFSRGLLAYATLKNYPARQAWPESPLIEAFAELALFSSFAPSRRLQLNYSQDRRDLDLAISKDSILDLLLARLLLNLPRRLLMADFELQLNTYEIGDLREISELWRRLSLRYYPQLRQEAFLGLKNGYEHQLQISLFLKPFSSLEFLLAFVLVLYEQPWQKNPYLLMEKFNRLLSSNRSLPLEKRIRSAGFKGLEDKDFLERAAFALADRLQL